MSSDSPVRIGIIGAGRFAETHLDHFARIDGAEVVALCRRNEDALREMQERFGIRVGVHRLPGHAGRGRHRRRLDCHPY